MSAQPWACWTATSYGTLFCCLATADQIVGRWTAHDVALHYGPYGQHPDPNVLTVLMMMVGAAFAAWMAWTGRLADRDGRGKAFAASLTALLAWGAVATVGVTAHEFNGFVLALGWRLALLLMAGLALLTLSGAGRTGSRATVRHNE